MAQALEDIAQISKLEPGVLLSTHEIGPRFNGQMLVSEDSRNVPDGVVLLQRYAYDTIFRVTLKPQDARLAEGGIHFDYWKGERIELGGTLGDYARYERELRQAGLE
jgi:hypothetical protein